MVFTLTGRDGPSGIHSYYPDNLVAFCKIMDQAVASAIWGIIHRRIIVLATKAASAALIKDHPWGMVWDNCFTFLIL
jgi:hypothetical protein